MKFILGKKLEMTQGFDREGNVIPVTRVKVEPCFVSQIKTKEKDGYKAIQLAFSEKKKIKKPQKGHLKGLKNFGILREFRVDEVSSFKRGQEIKVSLFEPGDLVSVTSFSKGKGFQGVVKRHGFKGAPGSHGTKDQLRMPGSIGATGPQRVFKGKRMPGRMGHDRVTIKNLEVMEVNQEKNELLIKGAVPGARNEVLRILGTGRKAEEKEEVKEEKVEVKKTRAKEEKEEKKKENKVT